MYKGHVMQDYCTLCGHALEAGSYVTLSVSTEYLVEVEKGEPPVKVPEFVCVCGYYCDHCLTPEAFSFEHVEEQFPGLTYYRCDTCGREFRFMVPLTLVTLAVPYRHLGGGWVELSVPKKFHTGCCTVDQAIEEVASGVLRPFLTELANDELFPFRNVSGQFPVWPYKRW